MNHKFEFTQREKDVIELLKLGYSNSEIAKKLFISIGTVRFHITNLLSKTYSKNRTNLIFNLVQSNYFNKPCY